MAETLAVNPNIKPGIYQSIPNDSYHAGPGISKSGLWTIETQSPAHYKFPRPRDEDSTQSRAVKDFGNAAHIAILEPNTFEARVYRGPDDRRGNKWKDADEFCKVEKKTLLTSGDYDNVLAVRDTVHANSRISAIITGGVPMVEASGYWIDEQTGELCRCRPDLWRPDLGIMLDLKTSRSAHPDAFARAVISYGYHAQEAFYTDGWNAALSATGRSDDQVQGFVFLAWEKEAPYAFGLYELPPSIVEEGRAMMRKALGTYAACRKADRWPGYSEDVTELPIKRWAYRLTQAPDERDEAAA